MDAYMSYTVIEIISGREHIVYGKRSISLRRHIFLCKIGNGLSLPVRIDLAKTFFRLFRDIERIGFALFNGIKFCFKPLIRIFGENLTTARSKRCASDDEFSLAYRYRNIFKYMSERGGASLYKGKIFRRFIAFGYKHAAVCLYLRHFRIKI